MVEFLASDAASFVTGATIPVDGGLSMASPRPGSSPHYANAGSEAAGARLTRRPPSHTRKAAPDAPARLFVGTQVFESSSPCTSFFTALSPACAST